MQVAPSTYYDQKSRAPSARQVRDRELGPALEQLWKKNYSVYGRRKLTKAAQRRSMDVGRDQVERLMKRQGIRGASRAKKRFTTHAAASHLRAPDLVTREFVASAPNQLWVADFTYCSTRGRRLRGLHRGRLFAPTRWMEGEPLDDRVAGR